MPFDSHEKYEYVMISVGLASKLHVLDSCPLQFKCCMVATYIKHMHTMTCVTLGCIQRRQLTCFWLVGSLGLSKF